MDAQVKKVRMPMGIRKKMMAAISMLLVASIMLVSSSYAWFTLSTAPEITGITTSVGANGNLEVALLPASGNTADITTGAGDSMAVQSATLANTTWGNLVDLSDSTYYGLDKITLYPAALNAFTGALGNAPLSIPEYGADGRVAELVATTVAAGYDAEEAVFPISDTPAYGVRAVGTSSSVSARQLTFKAAKGTYTAKVNGIAGPTKNAVRSNFVALLGIATAGGTPESLSVDELTAVRAMAVGVQNSLNNVVAAYANAGLAIAAASDPATVNDEAVALLSNAIAGQTSAASLKTLLNTAGVTEFDTTLSTLASEQSAVKDAITKADALLGGTSSSFASAEYKPVVEPLLGVGTSGIKGYQADNETPVTSLSESKHIYLTGGAVGAVAKYSGTFKVHEIEGLATAYAGAKGGTSAMADITTRVNGLTAPAGEGASNLTDFYGYMIDFAFRTNAADSDLLLQTEAANRVYSNETSADLATMGAGSTGTFTYNAESGLTSTQGQRLMESIRVAFFDPDSGNQVLKVGKFTNIDITDPTKATGELTLFNQSVASTTMNNLGKDAYEAAVTTYAYTGAYAEAECTNYAASLDADGYDVLAETTELVNTAEEGEAEVMKYKLGKDAYTGTTAHAVKASVTVGETTYTPDATNCWNFKATITPAEYAALADTSASLTKNTATLVAADDAKLVDMVQNSPKKLSVLVYMDGEGIDNSAVGNAISSGSLKLNLQFRSSATLVPMENNALKSMTKTTDTPAVESPAEGA